jgi:hypothetical protein
MGPE